MDEERSPLLHTPFVARSARWGIVAWSAIGVLVLGFFLFRYVLYPVRIIFPPLVVAMIAVYLLNPIVTALGRRGIRRGWATLIVYLVFGAIVGTAMYFLVPLVAEQVTDFVKAAPRIFGDAVQALRDLAARLGIDFQEATPSGDVITDLLGRVFSVTRGILDLAIVFILGPILAFYLLVDLPKIKRNLRALVPSRRRGEVEEVSTKIGGAIGSFFRGQLLVAGFVGLASALGLWIVGLPFWALVGLVTGLFNLIPLIGPFIGGGVAVFIAFTTEESGGLLSLDAGLPLAIGAAIALLIVQQIDNHIISPNMIGRTVHLHPVTVMLGLLVGGTLLGLWGMLLAIPVIATIKILILHAWDTRMTWPPPSSGEHRVVRDGEPTVIATPPAEVARTPGRRRPPGWWTGVRNIFGGRTSPRRTESSPAPGPGGNGPAEVTGAAPPEEAREAAAVPEAGSEPRPEERPAP